MAHLMINPELFITVIVYNPLSVKKKGRKEWLPEALTTHNLSTGIILTEGQEFESKEKRKSYS